MPAGSIHCTKSGKYTRWYLSNNGNKQYIKKCDEEFARTMARKKYLEYLRKDLKLEQKCIDSYLKISKSHERSIPMLIKEPGFIDLLTPVLQAENDEIGEWLSSSYESNKVNPEGLIYTTTSGHKVRSKSESMIAGELYLKKIPFRYECILNLGNKILFPDFTIRHPVTGEYFYWEHFGMMDNYEYAKKTSEKIATYISHGIIPSINLITTFETKTRPITQIKISDIVNEYFL